MDETTREFILKTVKEWNGITDVSINIHIGMAIEQLEKENKIIVSDYKGDKQIEITDEGKEVIKPIIESTALKDILGKFTVKEFIEILLSCMNECAPLMMGILKKTKEQ